MQLEGVQVYPGIPVLIHEPPCSRTDSQFPTFKALASNIDASHDSKGKGGGNEEHEKRVFRYIRTRGAMECKLVVG